jgi:hypothetical protein
MIILTGPLIALLLAFHFFRIQTPIHLPVFLFTYSYSFLRSFPCFPFSPFPIPHTNHQTCVVNHGQSDEIQGLKIS